MRNKLTIILFGLLLAVGWTHAMAQQQPTASPAERLALSVVDNVSVYDPVAQTNTYTNTLQLTQPANNKLTAGMLKNGDNIITIARQGVRDGQNFGASADVATIKLNAVKTTPSLEVINQIDFVNDGGSLPSQMEYFTNAQLQAIDPNWSSSSNGEGLVRTTEGSVFSRDYDGLTFTVPNGYSNATVKFTVSVGSNANGGYFTYQINSDSWSVCAGNVTANSTVNWVFSDINSGDIISFLGASVSNGQLGLDITPYIKSIKIELIPVSYMPSIDVIYNGVTNSYSPNDFINLSVLGNVTDVFSVETADNSHPDAYSYKADFDADIVLPEPGTTGMDFSATADFTACTTTNLTSGTFTGYNGWSFNDSFADQDDNDNIIGYIEYYGSILFTMPANFMGSTVNVTVTSGPCLDHDGSGVLYVNGVEHTFNGVSTYTWNVPVYANGVIEFKAPSNTWSADIASIAITSGNGSSMNAPIIQKKSHNDSGTLLKRSSDKAGRVTRILNSNLMRE